MGVNPFVVFGPPRRHVATPAVNRAGDLGLHGHLSRPVGQIPLREEVANDDQILKRQGDFNPKFLRFGQAILDPLCYAVLHA